jgi:hypothetical protein
MEEGESFAYTKDSNENLFTFAIGVIKNSNRQISLKRKESATTTLFFCPLPTHFYRFIITQI